MPKLKEVARHVRSKNAGPFWITLDIFFKDHVGFEAHHASASLSVDRMAALFDTRPEDVKRFEVPNLDMLKISFPRPTPQGGAQERDMHGGQMYVRLLDIELLANDPTAGGRNHV